MGSSGSGRFSDYPGTKNSKTNGTSTGGGGGASGGTSGIDKCRQAFSSLLEDVAQCDSYSKTHNVPAVGTELSLVLGKRVFAVDLNGTVVGALPTSFNYLAGCLESGITYVGLVKSSSTKPVPTIEADFVAQ